MSAVVVVEVKARKRSVQVVNGVLPVKLTPTRGQSPSRRVAMSRGVAVLPARGSREELVGRSIEEWTIAWSGRASARPRSGP